MNTIKKETTYKTKTVINGIFYSLLLLGILIVLYQYFFGYIKSDILLRAMGIYLTLTIFYFLSKAFLRKNIVSIAIIGLLLIPNVFYLRFFNAVDLCILLIPDNYVGDVSITMNVESSKTVISPINGIVVLDLKASQKIEIASELDIKLNTIVVAVGSKETPVSQRQLQFTKGESIYKAIAGRKYHIIKGCISTVKSPISCCK